MYNVSVKGANSQCMFYDSDDYETFAAALEMAAELCDVRLGARVMMINHVHLVVHAEKENMARFFKSVGARYVFYFNRKYNRTGPLWNGRFYSDPLESLEAYQQATAYIYNNPVAAKIAETPIDYPWSNFRAVYERRDTSTRETIAEAGDVDEILQYALDYSAERKRRDLELVSKTADNELFKDNDLIAFITDFVGGASITNIINLGEKVQRDLLKNLLELGPNVKQMSRLTGISIGRIEALLA